MYLPSALIDDREEVAIAIPSINKTVSKNHRTNQIYSRSKIQENGLLNEGKWIHRSCQPIIPVDELCSKIGLLIHQFYQIFFIFFKTMEKKH